MKKKIFKIVTVFATMLLVLSCLVTVFSKKVYADTTLPKVSGLTWDTTTDPEKFIGRWNAYNYEGFEKYFVELYHNNVRINDEHGGARPGIVSTATSYDFTDMIKEGGPGEYTFIVRAYVKDETGQSTWALEYTKSDMSDKFTYGTTSGIHLYVSKIESGTGILKINNQPDYYYTELDSTNKWRVINATELQKIKLEAFTYNGYRFTGWTTASTDVNVSNGSFSMPDHDVYVTANFESFYYDPKPTWETEDSFKAKWAKYDGCQGYKVTLYKSGYSLEKVGDTVTLVGDDKTSYDFSELVKSSGKDIYTYGIQAYFVDDTTTETFTSYDYKRYGYVEVDRIDFTVDTSSITKFAEGITYSDIKAELGELQNTDKLISGYSDKLKLDTYLEHVQLTSTNTSATEELADDALIDAETTYYLCFPFAINKEKVDRYTDTVAVPSGTSLIRYGDTLVYVFYPIKLGTTPDPGPSPDPDPTPGPSPDPDPTPTPNDNVNLSFDLCAQLIDNAKAGDTVTYDFGDMSSLPVSFMEKVAARPDLTYVFKCVYKSDFYEFTINPGTKFELDCLWYGPYKMAEMFDTKITDANGNIKCLKSSRVSGNGVYKIQFGDTLSKLAAQFNRTIEELLRLNSDITDIDHIVAGDTLNY